MKQKSIIDKILDNLPDENSDSEITFSSDEASKTLHLEFDQLLNLK